MELFSEYTEFFAGRRCPNGLRRFFGLNSLRLCCGGVAQELTSMSDATWCLLVDALPVGKRNFLAVCSVDSGDVRFCRDCEREKAKLIENNV